MPVLYELQIFSYGELVLNPQLVDIMNKIFKESHFDNSNNFYSKLLNYEYKYDPNFGVLFFKNEVPTGARTLKIRYNSIIFENGCVIRSRQGDFANFLKLLIYELIYGKYIITPLMEQINNVDNYYLISYIDKGNKYLMDINTMCYIDDIGYVCNYLTKSNGYDPELFPDLKLDWTDFKQAFVVRVHKGKIIKRLPTYVPKHMLNIESEIKNDSELDAVTTPITTPQAIQTSSTRPTKRSKSD